jgi:glutamate 5-kinase
VSPTRQAVAQARHLVVKVGSSSLTTAAGGLDRARLDTLVDALAARVAAGTHLVLVSSGAIAAGLAPLGLRRRPRDLATQQAAASVRRAHYRNAQRTFARLRGLGVLPVVNENDTVVTDEIRFGDNDRLAALVAHLVGADALVLLSDVGGLYDGDPRRGAACLVPEVFSPADVHGVRVGDGGALGTGGMASKLDAATVASQAGVPVLLAATAQVGRALGPADVGTAFAPTGARLSARRFWLRHAASAAGRLRLDDGAVSAVVHRRRSLLAAGIIGAEGDFGAGDVVELIDGQGVVVARGMVGFDATELPELIGRSTRDLPPELRREVVHADDLVPVSLPRRG